MKIYPVPCVLILMIDPKLLWVTFPVGHFPQRQVSETSHISKQS